MMEKVLLTLAAVAIAYLLGSFPSGFLMARLWGVNVLASGSGRTGGTNVLRSAGVVPAVLTGLLDVGKGVLAVWLAGVLTGSAVAQVLAGAAVVLGHNHSVFLRFRGGAGVGTSLGALAPICFFAALGLVVLLLLVIFTTRYASVGSLTVSTLMPIILLVLGLTGVLSLIYLGYGLAVWIIIVLSHRPNIRRLIAGTERRLGDKPQASS
jgi:glycerol-3-phosphate acyltransferase PlsY